MAAEPEAIRSVEEDRASREAAEANLAKDLAERMRQARHGGRCFRLQRSLSVGIVADAFELYRTSGDCYPGDPNPKLVWHSDRTLMMVV